MLHYKITNQTGWILFYVLIFIQLMSLIGIYSLHLSNRLFIVNKALWQRERQLWASKNMLQRIETNLLSGNLTCGISQLPVDITKQDLLWWQREACLINDKKMQYYYVVEFLTDDPCAQIKLQSSYYATYYRLTLLSLSPQREQIILQSTLIKPKSADKPCQGKSHLVTLGRQMWREI